MTLIVGSFRDILVNLVSNASIKKFLIRVVIMLHVQRTSTSSIAVRSVAMPSLNTSLSLITFET